MGIDLAIAKPRIQSFSIARWARKLDWKRAAILLLGIGLFLTVYAARPWADAVDPQGHHFALSKEAKGAIALFLLAGLWWIFEVVPIGITAIAIGVVQALFLIRKPELAFSNFLHPSVWFIFASLIIGKAFTKSGLTQRLAYNMLVLVGERTSMIYLGSFALISLLTLVMAHTAVAATLFPLLMAIYSLYQEDGAPTRFGKGLFLGMAYVAGASSIVTLLGAARGPVALGFFKDMTGREISFLEFSYYLLPVGGLMVLAVWGYFMIFLKPEKKTIPGLRERAQMLTAKLGAMSRSEWLALLIVIGTILALSLHSFISPFTALDRTGIILAGTLLFFVFKILTVQDLEEIPWNILLTFGGSMSMGLCLWQTGAATWLAVKCLALFQGAPWFLFVMGFGLIVLVMTNFIMNVAVLALALPIALALAPYLGVAPDLVLFALLVTAGMPFISLIGAAPNAIAFESRQFTPREFFNYGLPVSLILLLVLGLFVLVIWPLMGLPVFAR